MGIRHYQKLVRDTIPEIISQNGERAVTRILSPQEFQTELNRKLLEETQEFLQSAETDELADVLEVVYAIAELRGIGMETLESIRLQKQSTNGGFTRRIYLESVISKTK